MNECRLELGMDVWMHDIYKHLTMKFSRERNMLSLKCKDGFTDLKQIFVRIYLDLLVFLFEFHNKNWLGEPSCKTEIKWLFHVKNCGNVAN